MHRIYANALIILTILLIIILAALFAFLQTA